MVSFICIFSEWGLSLLTSNKDDWRRHRRIVGPAFNTSTYSIVWAETLRVYRDIITTEGWTQKDLVTLRPVQAYTIRVAFLVISACGFGLPFQWEGPAENDNGEMGLQEAMRIWVDTVFVRVLTPSWVYKLPFKRCIPTCIMSSCPSNKTARRLRDIATSTHVLRDYMTKMISERRAELNGESTSRDTERKDVFSLLVRASEEDSKFKLSDSELVSDKIERSNLSLSRCEVGNVFAMMFAGHGLCIFYLGVLNGRLKTMQKQRHRHLQQRLVSLGSTGKSKTMYISKSWKW